jgi:hypothetical protein
MNRRCRNRGLVTDPDLPQLCEISVGSAFAEVGRQPLSNARVTGKAMTET